MLYAKKEGFKVYKCQWCKARLWDREALERHQKQCTKKFKPRRENNPMSPCTGIDKPTLRAERWEK